MTLTDKCVFDETAEDWDEYFKGPWQAAGGSYQSLQFMFTALSCLQFPAKWNEVSGNSFTGRLEGFQAIVHDYGCALGDGTALLKARFPISNVVGYDISPKAVEVAKERWPNIEFRVGDVTNPEGSADIIFASHVLEHMKEPDAVIRKLMKYCGMLVVLVPEITPGNNGDHRGAAITQEWLRRLPPPMASTQFQTLRADPQNPETLYVEVSNLLVWKTLI